mgnify:CR=1 FL=1
MVRWGERIGLVLVLVIVLAPLSMDGRSIVIAQDSFPPPTLLGPANGAVRTGLTDPPFGLPTLRWQTVPGAIRYEVQISASIGFADPIVSKTTYALAFDPDKALADGTYYWRVRAGDNSSTAWGPYSEIWSFTKDWSANGTLAPSLVSPPEGAMRAAFLPDDFTWTPMPGAATYLFQIATDPAFSNIVYSATTLGVRHTPTKRLANNVYYWRVIPVDYRGQQGPASPTGSFEFRWDLAPQLIEPADDVELPFTPQFQWTAVESARQYELQISTQQDFSSPSIYNTRNTSLTPTQELSNDADYYWRVRATDAQGQQGPWSGVRRFRRAWHFAPNLLTPANNATRTTYPFFSWTPVPGAERYRVEIDESNSFNSPLIGDEEVFNAPTYAHPNWQTLQIDADYYWRVLAIDAQGNETPLSSVRTFRTSTEVAPNLVYPLPYYAPDPYLPVHGDRTLAWPAFVWDTAHQAFSFNFGTGDFAVTLPPAYYELTVDDQLDFSTPEFQIESAGLAAAPTLQHPFTGPRDGRLYYWRVRAFRGGAMLGIDTVWTTRFDEAFPQYEMRTEAIPIFPRAGFEAVEAAPLLGWLPVTGAAAYRVQISGDREFNVIVDEAQPQFVNYAPWQGRREPIPFGTYWWRVRAEDANGAPLTAWSEARHFNVSRDMVTGNPIDFVPPSRPASIVSNTTPLFELTHVADSAEEGLGAYELGALHAMLDRTYTGNQNWVFAFTTGAIAYDELWYGLYFDVDHREGSGASFDPQGKPITCAPLYLPDFALYAPQSAGYMLNPATALFYEWNGVSWNPPQTLSALGGDIWFDASAHAVQVLVPYSALRSADPASVGSLAFTVFSTSADPLDGVVDSIPDQDATIRRPAFVTDMVMPLYPFDTPDFNPIVHYDVPPMRWRSPYFDSVDGYQVEVARDAFFTDRVDSWETYESRTSWFFALLPATFQPTKAYNDNESYYWRARVRHERYNPSYAQYYDYGPWSPPIRFKLDSRQVTNAALSTGDLAQRTPTFIWDRVEGASGYTLQVDNDANFSSPLINQATDATSYTPEEMSSTRAMVDGQYYWRVAMRRSRDVIGHWTAPMTFTKSSLWPQPLGPSLSDVVAEQPTFMWAAVLTPTVQPRVAAPSYRVQWSSDPNFSVSPRTFDTDATSFTPPKTQGLADGTWYWRVAIKDGNGWVGPYSPPLQFYKEYRPPVLLSPAQGSRSVGIPTFAWEPLAGAAYYEIEVANNPLFNSPVVSVRTDNARYTPVQRLEDGVYYWRVRMFDADSKPGPFGLGLVNIGQHKTYLPFITQ